MLTVYVFLLEYIFSLTFNYFFIVIKSTSKLPLSFWNKIQISNIPFWGLGQSLSSFNVWPQVNFVFWNGISHFSWFSTQNSDFFWASQHDTEFEAFFSVWNTEFHLLLSISEFRKFFSVWNTEFRLFLCTSEQNGILKQFSWFGTRNSDFSLASRYGTEFRTFFSVRNAEFLLFMCPLVRNSEGIPRKFLPTEPRNSDGIEAHSENSELLRNFFFFGNRPP